MAKYIRQQVSDCIGGKKTRHYYRLENKGMVGLDLLAAKVGAPGSGLSRGEVLQVLVALPDVIAELLAEGHSVKLDGIGTFRAKLGLKTAEEENDTESDDQSGQQTADQDGSQSRQTNRNARSIKVTDVNFRADKDLVRLTRRYCHLTKGADSNIQKSALNKEQRIAKAMEYLGTYGVMRVPTYAELTGLSRGDAYKELRQLRYDPHSGISGNGNRGTLVYFKTPEQ